MLKQKDKIGFTHDPTNNLQERGFTNAKSFGWCYPLCNIAIVNYKLNVKFKIHCFGTVEPH